MTDLFPYLTEILLTQVTANRWCQNLEINNLHNEEAGIGPKFSLLPNNLRSLILGYTKPE